MDVLRLQNIYSWLETRDEDLKTILWKSLRFKQRGYFHSRLYKQRKWDGNQCFFSKETGRFLTGLLPEVQMALDIKGREYKIVDQRFGFDFQNGDIDDQFLNKYLRPGESPVTLHDYQVSAVNQISNLKRGIVRAPTGAGKSYVMCASIHKMPPKTPCLVMTKSVDLCYQLVEDLEKWRIKDIGKCIGSRKKDFCPNVVTVANVDSVHKIEKLLPLFRALYVDEGHLMLSKGPKDVYKEMKRASVRVAFSATPFKYGETDICQKMEMKGFFGPVLRQHGKILTTKELQERNILSSSKCIFRTAAGQELPFATYAEAVERGIVTNQEFHDQVVELNNTLKGRTLIIVERIEHGDVLHKMIPDSHWVSGRDSKEDRENAIEALRNSNKCCCIIQQKLISAGINFYCHDLIMAMGGKADHDIVQRMGRGLRRAHDKKGFTYHDFIFILNDYLYNHSMHRISVLESEGHEVKIED